jgi:ribulose-5-phosphate 4-epimerase/fuculose-1-phosphate aldolase
MRQGGKEGAAMTETGLREEICRLGRSLFERGLTPGSSGNISVRLDDGGWLVTPTNASLGFLDPARLSWPGLSRPSTFGAALKESKSWMLGTSPGITESVH